MKLEMILGFVGGGAPSGIIEVFWVGLLTTLSALSLVGSIISTFKKRSILAVLCFILTVIFGYYPCKYYVENTTWAEVQKARTCDFEVAVNLAQPSDYETL